MKNAVHIRAARRWLCLAFAAAIVAICPLGAAPAATARNVGFTETQIQNGAKLPLTIGIWYPTDAPAAPHRLELFTQIVAENAPVAGHDLPLVVLSHGGGGSYASHYDTALALAHAGFVAASVSHAGDTYADQSQALRLWRRPVQLRRLVSYMLNAWPWHGRLDRTRVGAFGLSNGGFTVLVAAGAIPDLDKTAPYCRVHPDHDLCQALRQAGIDPHLGREIPANAWVADPRIKAAVIAAPAYGFAFGRTGLSKVHIPIQLWHAADDRHQPDPWYDAAVRRALPSPPDYRAVAGARHDDFLPPCSPRMVAKAPRICTSQPGFDRAVFHHYFNAQIVRFFRAELR